MDPRTGSTTPRPVYSPHRRWTLPASCEGAPRGRHSHVTAVRGLPSLSLMAPLRYPRPIEQAIRPGNPGHKKLPEPFLVAGARVAES
jgi:hypothetical protein